MQQKNHAQTFHKAERLCSRRVMDELFSGGHKSMSDFPLRVVFMPLSSDRQEAKVSVLISVSKRRFKRAVKRNRVKRLIREAYRKNKSILYEALENCPQQTRLTVAFLWLSDRLYTAVEVEECVKRLLVRIAESLSGHASKERP